MILVIWFHLFNLNLGFSRIGLPVRCVFIFLGFGGEIVQRIENEHVGVVEGHMKEGLDLDDPVVGIRRNSGWCP